MENLARHLVDVRDTRSINRPIINTQSVRSPRRRSSTRGKETSKSTEENRSHEYSAADPLERRNITGLQVEEDRADRLNIFISVDGASSEIAISLCECSTLRLDVHTYVQVNIFILARAVNAVAALYLHIYRPSNMFPNARKSIIQGGSETNAIL